MQNNARRQAGRKTKASDQADRDTHKRVNTMESVMDRENDHHQAPRPTERPAAHRQPFGVIVTAAGDAPAVSAAAAKAKAARPATSVAAAVNSTLTSAAALAHATLFGLAAAAAAAPEPAVEAMELSGGAADDASTDMLLEVDDIDAYDRDNPQQCVAYINDIVDYMFEHETATQPPADYMKTQNDINEKMRSILVDWMVKNCSKLGLLLETEFLAVNVLDRFLSQRPITRHRLQLVGVGALLIAAKFEELGAPSIADLEYVSAKACSHDDILRIEKIILMTLDFDLSHPSPLHFLRRFSKAARSCPQTHTLSKYLIELTMPDYRFLQFRPSNIAAAAVYLSRSMIAPTEEPWNNTLRYYTRYDEADVLACAREMNAILRLPDDGKPPFHNVKAKYASQSLFEVSRRFCGVVSDLLLLPAAQQASR